MLQHEPTLNILYWMKEARYKRVAIVWFNLCEGLRKVN